MTIPEEDSVENARLASTKDTLMLKSLRNTSETIIEESVPTEECDANNLLDLENTAIEESRKTMDETTGIHLLFQKFCFK